MFAKLCALLRKKPEVLAVEPIFPVKKRPTIKKATTRTIVKKAVKKAVKDGNKKTTSKKKPGK